MTQSEKELRTLLEKVPDKYPDFIHAAVVFTAKDSCKRRALIRFLIDHPESDSSDVLDFISD